MKIYSGPVNFTPGSVVNGLVISGIISEGSTFRVFKAQSGTKFVTLKAPVFPDAMSVEILRREYELCSTLSHPCIVSTIGFEKESPVGPVIVMEFIEGLTLDEFVAHGATMAQRRSALKDILDGVDYLHHRGILHNDLKPDNIIVNANGAARIIDFGLSSSQDSIYKGCIGGSTGYTAPEILNGGTSASTASDIYSIGLLIRLLFSGRRYRSAVRKCCRTDPADRYPNINALRSAMSSSDRMPLVISVIVVLCVVVCLAIIPLFSEQQTQPPSEADVVPVADSDSTTSAQELAPVEVEPASTQAQTTSSTTHEADSEPDKDEEARLRTHFAAEIEPFYQAARDSIKCQDDKNEANIIFGNFMEHGSRCLDSLYRVYPVKIDGVLPKEVVIFSQIYYVRCKDIEALIKQMP